MVDWHSLARKITLLERGYGYKINQQYGGLSDNYDTTNTNHKNLMQWEPFGLDISYADPNSANHFSCFSISSWETLGWTFFRASWKSHIATGSFEISSFGMFLISSRVFPAILRLMPFKEASRHTFVRSSPLYPSV
uniref:Katanin p60 ATPase-containing subunit n=1 Tax=Rhizophora mucronata TaxID=61149 RepID=A0A2P2MFE1_RHIMU